MKIISKYVILDTLRVALLALLVFTAIFFVASSITATRGGITLGQFLRITPFIALYVVRFTLPISLLVGATFALGRLVADREVLALRACGVHYAAIVTPLLIVGLLCSAGMYAFNDRVLPLCDYARRNVLKSFAREILTLQKGRNRSFELPGYTVFCREHDGAVLRGLMIFRDDPKLPFEIIAREGRVGMSRDSLHIVISLKDVRITYYGSRDKISYGELVSENYSIFVPMRQRTKDRPGFMTMAELFKWSRELREDIDSLKASARENEQTGQDTTGKLEKSVYMKRKVDIEINRRGADSITPLLFLFVGIPLPLLLGSRIKLVPAFAALMIVMLTNFTLGLAAESFADSGRLDPWFAMWLGDILTVCIGLFLFWKLFEK